MLQTWNIFIFNLQNLLFIEPLTAIIHSDIIKRKTIYKLLKQMYKNWSKDSSTEPILWFYEKSI